MPNCLGIYIDGNIIKYAKVSKDNNIVKIEASGVKFHDNTEETIKNIVNETFSYKTPISVNLVDEQYAYAELFSLLNKKDLEKAVQSEFEYFCTENGKNKNTLQYKRLFIENPENRDKLKVIYSYVDRASLASKTQALSEFRLDSMAPLPFCLKNLVNFTGKKNSMIINLERITTVSTIVNGEIYHIDTLSKGMKDILDAITEKENSYEKSYEICKNTTIYTKEGKSLQTEANDYLDEIMPTLYSIIKEIKEVMAKNLMQVENIYITGLGAVINNIDLYFQENFENQKCEVLTPYFTEKTNIKVNIKDYIEVNSATALALQALGGHKEISFIDKKGFDKIGDLFGGSGDKKGDGKAGKGIANIFKFDLGTALDRVEKNMIRTAVGLLVLVILYGVATTFLINEMDKKKAEAQEVIDDTNKKIAEMDGYTQSVTARTEEYASILAKIEQASNEHTETLTRRNAIPNLLNHIMSAIPKQVQITNIQNTTGKTVKIEAQSGGYPYLGYFLAKLKTDGILLNVSSSESVKTGNVIRITITGDLPY